MLKSVKRIMTLHTSCNTFINAVIIGNVNAGKSSLCGRIAYDLGHVTGGELLEYRKQASELQRESYYLAWWSDRANIEREKGITIHNHFHCWQFPKYNLNVNITDISGYEYYLKNAIVGCALNDYAILLIDINEQFDIKGIQQLPNQNYMGSVLQQLLIIKALNINKIIVVLNKCDLFLNNLSNYKNYIKNIKNTIINIANNLKLDLKNKFYPFIIPISTRIGWNICNDYNKQTQHFLMEHLNLCIEMDCKLNEIYKYCSLMRCHQNNIYKKQTLLDVVSNIRIDDDHKFNNNVNNDTFKAIIKRVSITKNHLLLLYCLIIDGMIEINMKIRVDPYNIIIPIYSIQSFKETINYAFKGQLICIAVKISDINGENLNIGYNIENINNKFIYKYFQRGSLITDCNNKYVGPIEYFEAELDIIYAPYDLKMGYQLSCYSHCTHFRANLIHCFDKTWNDINIMNIKRGNNPNSIKDTTHLYSGEKCIVGFNVIDKQIILMNYDEFQSLGWIVIKDNKSYIVAIGKILYCGKKVTRLQICNAMTQISMNCLTKPIISIIADYAMCGS